MTGYEQFQQIMAEINFKKNMSESKGNNKFSDLPLEFEQLFGGFLK